MPDGQIFCFIFLMSLISFEAGLYTRMTSACNFHISQHDEVQD